MKLGFSFGTYIIVIIRFHIDSIHFGIEGAYHSYRREMFGDF